MNKEELKKKLIPTLDLLNKHDITFEHALNKLLNSFQKEFNKSIDVMVEVEDGMVSNVILLNPDNKSIPFSYIVKDWDNIKSGDAKDFYEIHKNDIHAETILKDVNKYIKNINV